MSIPTAARLAMLSVSRGLVAESSTAAIRRAESSVRSGASKPRRDEFISSAVRGLRIQSRSLDGRKVALGTVVGVSAVIVFEYVAVMCG